MLVATLHQLFYNITVCSFFANVLWQLLQKFGVPSGINFNVYHLPFVSLNSLNHTVIGVMASGEAKHTYYTASVS